MIKNYFKIAIRNLLRNKGFSAINISGLCIGMASAILILLWIQSELNYDGFHEKKDRIYEMWNKAEFSGKMQCWSTTPKVLARTLERDIPEVERAVRVNWPSNYLLAVGDKKLTVQGNMVDSGFLQMFSFPLKEGNPVTALNDMHSMVVTEKLARKMFGTVDVMGKTINLNNKDNFTITGILKDLPYDSRFNFEYLLPWSYLRSLGEDDENWSNNSTITYVMLKEHTSLASVAPKVKVLKQRYDKEDPTWELFMYPMKKWRLYSSFRSGVEEGGKIELVKLFGIIAAFILLIACINFMNLSTARSEKRAKEVGIRKVVGAPKSSLIGQFIGESIFISFLAGLLAILVVEISLPGFNSLTGKNLFIHYGDISFWIIGFCFILFTGLLAGSYPAFFLSSFQPIKVLKGTFKSANALVTPRKVLVVLQFTFAIVLIICTLVVKQQISYAQERDSGYNRNNLVYHFLTGDIDKNYSLIKQELIQSGTAVAISKTSAPLTQGWSDSWGFEWAGKQKNDKTDFDRYCADNDIARVAGFEITRGRDFNLTQYPTDSTAVILNESAVKAMGFKEPIGQIVKDNGIDWHVVGVIKDFILQSPYHPMKPMVIEGSKGWFQTVHVRFNPKNSTAASLKAMEGIFRKYNPAYPFEYHFIDEDYAKKFDDEKRMGTLAVLFAGLTIFISCLGLFGLATYMAENRIKEIGVRKVLGASVTMIAALLSKDFLKLVIISFLIASPLAWWAMDNWLQHYPFRVNIQWWVFAAAGLISMLIAIITVSYQAIKAALASPVKNLRTE